MHENQYIWSVKLQGVSVKTSSVIGVDVLLAIPK